ncbi:MAG TPA: glycoside hydrolase family 18 protein [Rudaea sp.]|nr:glycoside hydrolase family 18 protein [Rudaea sp.]
MNVRLICIALTLASAALPAAANDTLFASGFDPVWVMGYHVGYQSGMYPTADVDFAALSHVIIGPVTPNTNGTVNTSFDITDVDGPIWAAGVAAAAHNANRKALLMIGGAGSITGWQGAASNTNRAGFVTNLLTTMDAIGADGLDLDWEPLASADYANFSALAQALRTARPTMTLTVPVGWVNSNFQTPATADPFFGTIAPLFDRIDIMSYDMEWPADGWDSWFTSALHGESATTPSSIDSSVDYYLASGVPRGKLGIGIGFYGQCWKNVTGPRQTIGPTASRNNDDNTFTYHNIVTQYYSAPNYQYDATSEMPYLGSASAFGPGNCNFLSYENAQSVTAKGNYVNRNGLAGTIIWTIGEGYVPEQAGQENALLDAVNAAFHPGN